MPVYDDDDAPSPSSGPGRPGRSIRRAPASGDVVPSRPRRPRDEPDEGPLESDIERFSDPTRPCPNCGKTVYDDTAVCYHCGHALENTTAGSPGRKSLTVAIVVGVLILAMVLAAVTGMF